MDSTEVEAKTIEKAISIACEQLKTDKENLKIEILQDEPGKVLALLSGKKAKIRATVTGPAQVSEDMASSLQNTLAAIVKKIYPDARVEVKRDQENIVLNILGDGSGIFIGKRGQTLDALQYIINKIKKRNFKDFTPVIVDSESYHARHIQSLENLAKKLSEKARRKNGPVTTDPLNPADRRVIHLTLKNSPGLTTWSKGDGLLKKVFIAPKQS